MIFGITYTFSIYLATFLQFVKLFFYSKPSFSRAAYVDAQVHTASTVQLATNLVLHAAENSAVHSAVHMHFRFFHKY
jgi:hypothetical protein